jgi:hypothetical protein
MKLAISLFSVNETLELNFEKLMKSEKNTR